MTRGLTPQLRMQAGPDVPRGALAAAHVWLWVVPACTSGPLGAHPGSAARPHCPSLLAGPLLLRKA